MKQSTRCILWKGRSFQLTQKYFLTAFITYTDWPFPRQIISFDSVYLLTHDCWKSDRRSPEKIGLNVYDIGRREWMLEAWYEDGIDIGGMNSLDLRRSFHEIGRLGIQSCLRSTPHVSYDQHKFWGWWTPCLFTNTCLRLHFSLICCHCCCMFGMMIWWTSEFLTSRSMKQWTIWFDLIRFYTLSTAHK